MPTKTTIMFLIGVYLNKIYHVQGLQSESDAQRTFHFTMELCNNYIIGPVFSHASGI